MLPQEYSGGAPADTNEKGKCGIYFLMIFLFVSLKLKVIRKSMEYYALTNPRSFIISQWDPSFANHVQLISKVDNLL